MPSVEDGCQAGQVPLQEADAKELAANVSVAMLDEMRCKEGTWQTIKAPCPREEESLALPQSAGLGVTWAVLALGFAALNIL